MYLTGINSDDIYYNGGSGGFVGTCVVCARVLESMEPTVAGMSMKEMFQFERSILGGLGVEGLMGIDWDGSTEGVR